MDGGLDSDVLNGGDGDDKLLGGDGADTINAGAGNDVVEGGLGNDTIRGDAGNDLLNGDRSNDLIYGGDGDDTIYGGLGSDDLYGEADNDTIYAGINAGGGDVDSVHRISGGSGSDTVHGDIGIDTIEGNDGDDTLYGLSGSDTLVGGWGKDTIFGGASETGSATAVSDINTIYGDLPTSDAVPGVPEDHGDRIYGDMGDDTIASGPGSDSIFALAGNDLINSGDGDDRVFAGSGNDIVYGQGGKDTLAGEGGIDFLVGGPGNDTINGGSESDAIWGGVQAIEQSAFLFDVSNTAGFDLPPDWTSAEAKTPTSFTPPRIMPKAVFANSLDGTADDGDDDLIGGTGIDWIFGGGGDDTLRGDEDSDYLDGGAGDDEVAGGPGDDVLRGGSNRDILHGNDGIDQLYGDSGTDYLYGDAGRNANLGASQTLVGQRLWGGDDIDYLYAYASSIQSSAIIGTSGEAAIRGDELHGGSGADWLYGNIRREYLFGEAGNDTILGDWLRGPDYVINSEAAIVGGDDTLYGDSGEDKLYGGGGSDTLWGGFDSDWLEGQDGNDMVYGGSGIDKLKLDTGYTNAAGQFFFYFDSANDAFDGHRGNSGIRELDDNATDILVADGTQYRDRMWVSQTNEAADSPGPRLQVEMEVFAQIQITGATSASPIVITAAGHGLSTGSKVVISGVAGNTAANATWVVTRISDTTFSLNGSAGNGTYTSGGKLNPVQLLTANWRDYSDARYPNGRALVEQIQLSGQVGNDDIQFLDNARAKSAASAAPRLYLNDAEQLRTSDLTARSDDWFGVIEGGPGDDTLRGSSGRDRIDGGFGSDTIYGMAGDDQLWGDGGREQGSTNDTDRLYGGQGDDDLLGGQGANYLYAWSQDPRPSGDTEFGVFVDQSGNLTDGSNGGQYALEDTGLNRMLGGVKYDELYGGNGLDFMYGTDNNVETVLDLLYDAKGQLFGSRDGQLAGDEWKDYAKTTNKVWYYSGSNREDLITVDYVTEPGLLQKHHLITRLTNNNGNFTFDARVQLDFAATDASGKPIWNPNDTFYGLAATAASDLSESGRLSSEATFQISLDGARPIAISIPALSTSDNQERLDVIARINEAIRRTDLFDATTQTLLVSARLNGNRLSLVRNGNTLGQSASLMVLATNAVARNELGLSDGLSATQDFVGSNGLSSLLPPEGDFLAIIVDALGGNDTITVGPTVVKSVWVDGGSGDDRIEFKSGQPILPDLTEVKGNSTSLTAYNLQSKDEPGTSIYRTITGLTLDSPTDEDWYRFKLNAAPKAGDSITATSLAASDAISLELYKVSSGTATLINSGYSLAIRGVADAVANGVLTGNVSFDISVDGLASKTITVLRSSTLDNQTVSDLVKDINDAIKTAKLENKLVARLSGKRISLVYLNPSSSAIASLSLTKVDTVAGALLGFKRSQVADALARIDLTASTDAMLADIEYQLRVSSDKVPTVYQLAFASRDWAEPNDVSETAFDLDNVGGVPTNIANFGLITDLTLHSDRDIDNFKFTLTQQQIDEFSATGYVPRIDLVRRSGAAVSLWVTDADGLRIGETVTTSPNATVSLPLKDIGLVAGRTYNLRVTATVGGFSEYDLQPVIGLIPGTAQLSNPQPVTVVNLGSTQKILRRDVLLGGTGNDTLQGGSYEEWIFGGDDNDVLTGGSDRQAATYYGAALAMTFSRSYPTACHCSSRLHAQ